MKNINLLDTRWQAYLAIDRTNNTEYIKDLAKNKLIMCFDNFKNTCKSTIVKRCLYRAKSIYVKRCEIMGASGLKLLACSII